MATNLWSDDELREALRTYLQVLAWEASSTAFSSSAVHRALIQRALPTRTLGSVARRMSNISAVLKQAGEPYAKAYKPDLDHVGANVTATLLRLLRELRNEAVQPTTEPATLLSRADALLATGNLIKPAGNANPPSRQSTTKVYSRSPEVVAWVLRQANGICEACGDPAPFAAANGRPFLEVHHVTRLVDGGPDIVENAVAVCPNCHRRLHYSRDAKSYRKKVLARNARLKAF